MKKELIVELLQKFEQAAYEYKGIDSWSARELQQVFNYTEWRNFLKAIDKAQKVCETAGEAVSDHFVGFNKMIELAKGAQREVDDIALTRYACYLIAQNGDASKSEIK
jgi:DNA-damage-inducible protein D